MTINYHLELVGLFFGICKKKFLNTFVNHCAKELTQEKVKN